MLRWLTDASLAESIAGDLAEERRRRAAAGSPILAAMWFWRSALALIVFLAARRLQNGARQAACGCPFGHGREWRQAFRSLRRTPWYSLTVIGVIALAMSLATTVFAIVDGVLFKPLPYPQTRQLFRVGGERPDGRSPRSVSPDDVAALAAALPSARFSLYGDSTGNTASLGDLRHWMPVTAEVGRDFFDALGVYPFIGGFTAADFEPAPGLPTPALISHGLWRLQFGARWDVIGQILTEYTATYGPRVSWRVAGVLPEGFQFPTTRAQPNLLTPLVPAANERRRRRFDAIVRIPADLQAADVLRRLNGVAARIEVQPESAVTPWTSIKLVTIDEDVTKEQAPAFRRVFWSAMALMLLAAVSVAGLVASRIIDRRPELVLRAALGASGAQLARLVFLECAVISALGGLIGLALTRALMATIVPLIPDNVGLFKSPAIDVRVACFALLTSMVMSIGVSVAPIRASVRRSSTHGVTTTGTTRRTSPGRFVVIASQISLGLLLTATGAFMVNSLLQVRLIDPGFVTDHLFVVTAEVVNAPTAAERTLKTAEVLRRLRAAPGVVAVGATRSNSILRRSVSTGPFDNQDVYPVTAGFFETLGISVVDGRLPSPAEIEQLAPVVVVSEAVARQFFGSERAIGRTIPREDRQPPSTVIGIVRETRLNGWDFGGYGGEVYMPFENPSAYFSVFVRTTAGADDRVARFLQAGAGVSEFVRITRVATAQELLDDTIRVRRFRSWMFGGAAAMALIIVACSVLGLIAMSTARRTREIGIRVALGSTRGSTVGLLIREQSTAVLVGLVVGGVAAAWAVRLLSAQFFQTKVTDAVVWVSAVGLIVGAAGFGALIPALRASRVDPIKALRVD